jgi:hypothetical protein
LIERWNDKPAQRLQIQHENYYKENDMKFLVHCAPFTNNVVLNAIESTDLVVEAPSARIAEAKVRSWLLYRAAPGRYCVDTAEPIEDEKVNILHNLRPFLKPFIYTTMGVFFLLFCWDVPWHRALLYAPVISFFILWLVPICYFFMATATGDIKKQEEIAELEREYSRREGYSEGWSDCKNKANPKFTEWVEADSQDINPHSGTASRIK